MLTVLKWISDTFDPNNIIYFAGKLRGSIGSTAIIIVRAFAQVMPLFRAAFYQKNASPGRGSILSAANSIILFGRCYNVSNLMGVHCTRIPAPPIVVVNQQPGGKESANFEAQRRGVGGNWRLFNLIINSHLNNTCYEFFEHFKAKKILFATFQN